MKRGLIMLSVFVIFCGALAFSGLTVLASVSAEEVFRDWIPIRTVFFNSCRGERVFVEGQCHIVARANQDGSFDFQRNCHGTGVGQLSGNQYVFNDSAKQSADINLPACEGELSFRDKIMLISTGPLPNQVIALNNACTLQRGSDGSCKLNCFPQIEVDCRGEEQR